jgi:hypothetical protein
VIPFFNLRIDSRNYKAPKMNGVDIGSLATIAIAINLAYINLDNYRYLKRMGAHLYDLLDKKTLSEIKGIFSHIESLAKANLDGANDDPAIVTLRRYSFLQLFGDVSKYKRVDPLTGDYLTVPKAQKAILAFIDSENDNHSDKLEKIINSTFDGKQSVIKKDFLEKFYFRFFYQHQNDLRTTDQLWSIVALASSLFILFSLTISSVTSNISVPDIIPTNQLSDLLISWLSQATDFLDFGFYQFEVADFFAVFAFFALRFVYRWLEKLYKIKGLIHETEADVKDMSLHSSLIFKVPLILAVMAFIHMKFAPWLMVLLIPYCFIFILILAILAPLQLLLESYQKLPYVKKQMEIVLKDLVEASAKAIASEKRKETTREPKIARLITKEMKLLFEENKPKGKTK